MLCLKRPLQGLYKPLKGLQPALGLLAEVRSANRLPNVITYNAAISACGVNLAPDVQSVPVPWDTALRGMLP